MFSSIVRPVKKSLFIHLFWYCLALQLVLHKLKRVVLVLIICSMNIKSIMNKSIINGVSQNTWHVAKQMKNILKQPSLSWSLNQCFILFHYTKSTKSLSKTKFNHLGDLMYLITDVMESYPIFYMHAMVSYWYSKHLPGTYEECCQWISSNWNMEWWICILKSECRVNHWWCPWCEYFTGSE